MTLTEIRYIIAVANERHFGRAAKQCNVSQPTLSVAIKKLEDELQVQLFERGAGEIMVTPIGAEVIEQGRKVLEEAGALKQIAQQGKGQLREPLRLGAIHTVGPYVFPELIPQIKKMAPEMPLFVEEGMTAQLLEKLKSGTLDVLIVAEPFQHPGIVTLPLYDEPFVALLPSAHPKVEKDILTSSDFKHEALLLLGSGNCFRDQLLDACPALSPHASSHQKEIQQTVEGSSLETIKHMVASGLGVTVVPCTAAGADKYAKRLLTIRRFMKKSPTRRIVLAWRVSFPRPKVVDALKESVSNCGLGCVSPL